MKIVNDPEDEPSTAPPAVMTSALTVPLVVSHPPPDLHTALLVQAATINTKTTAPSAHALLVNPDSALTTTTTTPDQATSASLMTKI